MTQRDRVLHALRITGPRGVCQVDFIRYPTIDGGPPITRLAARIEELKQDGYAIEDGGLREKTKVYVLGREAPARVTKPGALFETPARLIEFDDVCPPRNAIYDDAA